MFKFSEERKIYNVHVNKGFKASTDLYFLQRMKLERKLDVHTGCVNTISWNADGTLILSGSDDQHIALTNPFSGKSIVKFRSGHRGNIFCAKFLPGSFDRQLVSCSSSGEIFYTDLDRPESYGHNRFDCHYGSCYKLLTAPNEPHTFLSCGEDCTVRFFDLRIKTSCHKYNCAEDVIIHLANPVTAMAIDPIIPHQMVVASSCGVIRLYDRRMLKASESKHANDYVLLKFLPPMTIATKASHPKMFRQGKHRHYRVTSVNFRPFSHDLLVNYSAENIYLFNTYDAQMQIKYVKGVCQTQTKDSQPSCSGVGSQSDGGDATAGSHNAGAGGSSGSGTHLSTDSASSSSSSECSDPDVGTSFNPIGRVRVRGDWSDTGPDARPRCEGTASNVSAMQRMSDVLTRIITNQRPPGLHIHQQTGPQDRPPPQPDVPSGGNQSAGSDMGDETASTLDSVEENDMQQVHISDTPSRPEGATSMESISMMDTISPNLSIRNESQCQAASFVKVSGVETQPVNNMGSQIEKLDMSSEALVGESLALTQSPPIEDAMCTEQDGISREDSSSKSEDNPTGENVVTLSHNSEENFTCNHIPSTDGDDDGKECVKSEESPIKSSSIASESSSCLLTTSSDHYSMASLWSSSSGSDPTVIATPQSLPQVVMSNSTSQPPLASMQQGRLGPLVGGSINVDEGKVVDDSCIQLFGRAPPSSSSPSSPPQMPTTLQCTSSAPQSKRQEPELCELPIPQDKGKGQGKSSSKFNHQRSSSPPKTSSSSSSSSLLPSSLPLTKEHDQRQSNPKLKYLGSLSPPTVPSQSALSTEDSSLLDSSSCIVSSSSEAYYTPYNDGRMRVSCSPAVGSDTSSEDIKSSLGQNDEGACANPIPSTSSPAVAPEHGSEQVETDTASTHSDGDRQRRVGVSLPPTGNFQLPHPAADNNDDTEQEAADDDGGGGVIRESDISRAMERIVERPPAARLVMNTLVRNFKKKREAKEVSRMLEEPQPKVCMKFSGHRNCRTMIKEANFYGDSFVMSGSDCGRIMFWDRETGKLVMYLDADKHVVNCVKPHPSAPIIASSGIDYDVKIWSPTEQEPQFDAEGAAEIICRNELMLEETRDTVTVPSQLIVSILNAISSMRADRNRDREEMQE